MRKSFKSILAQWLLGVCWQHFNITSHQGLVKRRISWWQEDARPEEHDSWPLVMHQVMHHCENHLSDIQEDLFTVRGFLGSITLHWQSLGSTLMVGQVGSHSPKKQPIDSLAARFPWPSWCGGMIPVYPWWYSVTWWLEMVDPPRKQQCRPDQKNIGPKEARYNGFGGLQDQIMFSRKPYNRFNVRTWH